MNTQIYEEASEWIILHRSEDLDAEAKRRFDAWLRESPQHLRAYLEMSTIWEDVPALHREWNASASELIARARVDANVIPLGPEKVSSTVIPAEVGIQLDDHAKRSIPTHEPALVSVAPAFQSVPVVTVVASQHSSFGRYAIAIAATVLMLVGTGWFYLQRGVYSTDTGEQRTLALTDGSTVELNAQTRIRIAYTDNQRTIELLRGQALFKVAKDPNRPFIVDTNTTHIRAVGTQFDVYKKNTGTQITVVEGRVAVAAQATPAIVPAKAGTQSNEPRGAPHQSSSHLTLKIGEVFLSAGERILIAQGAERPTPDRSLSDGVSRPREGGDPVEHDAVPAPMPQPANIEAATAWTQQRLIFDFTPLTEVAQEFNRYNRRPLVIDDPILEDFNISGSFSSTDPTLLLRFLRDQPGIVVNENPTEIRISRQGTTAG